MLIPESSSGRRPKAGFAIALEAQLFRSTRIRVEPGTETDSEQFQLLVRLVLQEPQVLSE